MKFFSFLQAIGTLCTVAFSYGNALAAPTATAKSAVVAGTTALPALSATSSATITGYSLTVTAGTLAAGALYVGSTSLNAGTTTVAPADIARLRYVPLASIASNTTVTFTYSATDASGTSAAATYTLTVVRASTLDFAARTANEDWTAGRSVTLDNTTLAGSALTYSTNATARTLAVGNPSNRLPGTALAWGSTYATTTNPGTDGTNNTSSYTFTFSQPVSYFSLTLTDVDAGTSAANQSDFIDNVTLNAYSSASSTTAITYDNVSMATGVNSAATPTLARNALTNSIIGTSSNNAAANGTVVVSFAGQVQRLVVTYKNTATYTSGNNRIQNLGIPSMTWAYSLTPLPVTLVSFAAKATSNHTNVVTWSTASELTNDHFAVERSFDGTHFAVLGIVSGQGTSTAAHTYSFTDSTVPTTATRAYYRLQQVDLDGTATYSPVRSVALASFGATLATLYPSPASSTATLDLSSWPAGPIQAQVLSLNGQTKTAFVVQGGQLNTLDVEGLATGCYLLQLAGEQGSHTLRLFRQ